MTLPAHRFEQRKSDAEALSDVPGFEVPNLDIWKPMEKDKDFEQANRYLNLVAPGHEAEIIAKFKTAEPEQFRADDLLRAAHTEPAQWSDELFLAHLYRLLAGKKFHTLLLADINGSLCVVDGFHRLSVAYHLHNQLVAPVLRVQVTAP